MCVICLQFEMYKDIEDVRRMLVKARTENGVMISEEHLGELQRMVQAYDRAKAYEQYRREQEEVESTTEKKPSNPTALQEGNELGNLVNELLEIRKILYPAQGVDDADYAHLPEGEWEWEDAYDYDEDEGWVY